MIRLAVVVEGRTEMEFVRDVLAEHLRERSVEPQPMLIGKRGHKGGNVSVDRLVPDMANLYRSADYVTSLVDFYGFRGRGGDTAAELERRIDEAVGKRIGRGWNPARVFAYVQQYEFEASCSPTCAISLGWPGRRRTQWRRCTGSAAGSRRPRTSTTTTRRASASRMRFGVTTSASMAPCWHRGSAWGRCEASARASAHGCRVWSPCSLAVATALSATGPATPLWPGGHRRYRRPEAPAALGPTVSVGTTEPQADRGPFPWSVTVF